MIRGLIVVAAVVGPPSLAGQSFPAARFDRFVEDAMAVVGVPGVAVAVVRGDSVVHLRGYGVRAAGRAEPVDSNTVFAIGSATKSFTAMLLAMQVTRGQVGWDDRVIDRYPDFRLADPWVTREITIRDLLSHRSGLPRCDLWYDAPSLSRAELIRRLRFCPPMAGFRTGFSYQNILYLTAGEISARLAGSSWDELVATEILRPLGMGSSNTSIRQNAGPNVATPHALFGRAAKPVPWRSLEAVAPAGSINSTAADLARWVRFLLRGGTIDGRRVVGERELREMTSYHTPVPTTEFPQWAESPFTGYGLGWVVWSHRGLKVVQHSGGIDGMGSDVGWVPDRRLGVVVLTNLTESVLPGALVNWILDVEAGVEPRDWARSLEEETRALEAEASARRRAAEAARPAGTRPSLALAAYQGRYRDSLAGAIDVVADGDGIAIRSAEWAGPLRLAHWGYDVFRGTWPGYRLFGPTSFVSFEIDRVGRVASVTIEGLSRFGRVPGA